MTRSIAFLVFGLALTGAGTVEAVTPLPWSTVSDLERNVTQVYAVTGCGDPRPMGVYVVQDRLDTYHLIVNVDVRWAIIGPTDAQGATSIWYGTFGDGDRLVIERSLVGTPTTDVCSLLTRQKA